MSAGATNLGVVRILADVGAAFLALLLAATVLHKALRWKSALAATRALTDTSDGLSATLLAMALLAEACAALLLADSLLNPAARASGALAAAVIWVGYSGFMLRALVQQRNDIDCGCSFGAGHVPLGHYQLARNTTLIALAAFLASTSVSAPAYSAPAFAPSLLAASMLLVAYAALDQVMALRPLRAGALQ